MNSASPPLSSYRVRRRRAGSLRTTASSGHARLALKSLALFFRHYDGQKLIYGAGKDVSDTWGGSTDFGLNCNMTGGSSGGPWYVGFGSNGTTGSLNSVNIFKYTVGKLTKYMFGPYFGAYAQATYDAAKTATGNTLVAG